MKIFFSFSLCFILFLIFPSSIHAQETDANSKLISLTINDANWAPQITKGEYLLEKSQKVEIVSVAMYGLEDRDITNLTFKIVRFKGEGNYKVGEKNSLIGVYQLTAGTKQGPIHNIVEGSGKVEITAYDAKNLTISGKFSFDLKAKDSDELIKVREGKFKNLQLGDVTPEEKE